MSAIILGFALIAVFALIGKWRRRTQLPLPPGPKPLPLIGNVLDMPTIRPWEKYSEWCKTYNSNVIFLHLPIQPIVILGSVKVAVDLLEKRSHLYSNRVRPIMTELMGWDFNFGLMSYGARWRAHRRLFHQHFQSKAVRAYVPTQLAHARVLLTWILQSPQNTPEHLRHAITSIIFTVIYGTPISTMNHKYAVAAERAVEGLVLAAIPGRFWVEFLPILRYIPAWFPGASFKKVAEKYIPHVAVSCQQPYDDVKDAIRRGHAPYSVARTLIEEVKAQHDSAANEASRDEIAKNVTGLAYAAANDTTICASKVFLLAMALYPEVQQKAQDELDRVVGPHRLPDFDDMPNLPYIRAISMEVSRWMPVAPFGLPHAVAEDDVYEGYRIPKGAVLISDIWGMTRNPIDYPNPEQFSPERFLKEDGSINPSVRDPSTITFGFGRRICPGMYFATNNLVLIMMTILHVFNIEAGVDSSGKPIQLSTEMIGGLTAGPRNVPCGFKPRSDTAAKLIRELNSELTEA